MHSHVDRQHSGFKTVSVSTASHPAYVCQMFGPFLRVITHVEYLPVVKCRYVPKASASVFSGEWDPYSCSCMVQAVLGK